MNIRSWTDKAWQTIGDAVARFPLASLIALLGTALGLMFVNDIDEGLVPKLLMTLSIGFPLSVAATVFGERFGTARSALVGYGAVVVAMLAHQALFWNVAFDALSANYVIQHLLWVAVSALLVALAPFHGKGPGLALDFWNYAVRIAFAAATTFLYAGVLYAGISIALLSVNFLFDLDIDGVRWAELWVVMAGLFAPLFFLARYPRAAEQAGERDYPRELRAFVLYVLAPLVGVYLLILYSYTIKILLAWEWPKGTVSSMILGFSMLGILTYALLYPLVRKEERLRKGAKAFFIALLPQVAVMLAAVWVRVSAYGITEQRYLLVAFAIWLLVVSAYFLWSKAKDLRFVAVSLLAVTAISSFGPWGMFAVSEASQVSRLEEILAKNGILANGTVKPAETSLSKEDAKEVSGIVNYLHENHGLESIGPWLESGGKLELTDCDQGKYGCISPEAATAALGVDYVSWYMDAREYPEMLYLSTGGDATTAALKTDGYEYVVTGWSEVIVDGTQYFFLYDANKVAYDITRDGQVIASLPLRETLDRLAAEHDASGKSEFSPEEMSATFENDAVAMKLYFMSVNGRDPYGISGDTVLFTFK